MTDTEPTEDAPQSALLLTDQEWTDLAGMCKTFCALTLYLKATDVLQRRHDLAKRIIDAA